MTGRENQDPLISRRQLTHPPPGIIISWLLWGPAVVSMQSGLCRVKAVAIHPEDHLTLEEIKPRVHLRDYWRDLVT